MALTRQQMDELKHIMESRCVALADEIRAGSARARDESPGTLAKGGMDSADVAVTDQIADLDNAELLRDVRELRQLEAALSRLGAGSFGQCIDCGEEIDFARLRAQPAASRCLDCQHRHESTHAHPATPTL